MILKNKQNFFTNKTYTVENFPILSTVSWRNSVLIVPPLMWRSEVVVLSDDHILSFFCGFWRVWRYWKDLFFSFGIPYSFSDERTVDTFYKSTITKIYFPDIHSSKNSLWSRVWWSHNNRECTEWKLYRSVSGSDWNLKKEKFPSNIQPKILIYENKDP